MDVYLHKGRAKLQRAKVGRDSCSLVDFDTGYFCSYKLYPEKVYETNQLGRLYTENRCGSEATVSLHKISEDAKEAEAYMMLANMSIVSGEFQIGVCQRVHGEYSRAPLRLSPLSSFC